jgi:similar to spore coat protein
VLLPTITSNIGGMSMSWLNNFLGEDANNNNNSMPDKYLALELLTTSKNDITLLSKAITETVNPQLRQILTNQLNACINDHFQLSDLATQKGWYNAFTSPGQQIKQDLQEAQNLNNQNQQ